MKVVVALSIFLLFAGAHDTYAALGDTGRVHAKVIEISDEYEELIPGTETSATIQTLTAITDDGMTITLVNDRVPLDVGESFYATYQELETGLVYTVSDADRRFALVLALVLFALVTVAVGGWVGARALVSLAASVALIVYVLLPQLAQGASPILASVLCATLILAVAMVITHGWTRTTLAALGASIVTILVAIFLGEFFVGIAHLSGFSDDVSNILNLSTGNTLNMQGLLLGAMIIGVLGIIDDLAITQVITVSELKHANSTLSRGELYLRAMRVGREHLGAVVNTLVLAYAGASLPLLLLFTLSPTDPVILLNSEVMSVEIIRAAVGGVALALIVPIATLLGVYVAQPKDGSKSPAHHHSH